MGCHPSAVIGATVGIKVGDGFGLGGSAVGPGVFVGSGMRAGIDGAAKVGNGDEAAFVVASQADNMTGRQHRMAKNLNLLVFIPRISCIPRFVSCIVHQAFFDPALSSCYASCLCS